MAKIVDITDKLNFEEKPILKIGKHKIKVNNSAKNLLKVMNAFENGDNDIKSAQEALGLLFDEEGQKVLDDMSLGINDFLTVIRAAIDLVTNNSGDDEQGES